MPTQYTTYDQVPWFRKWWFAAIGCFVFMPAIVVMAFTGNFYFSKQGRAQAFVPWYKFFLLGLCLLAILGYVLEDKQELPKVAATISESELKAMFNESMDKAAEVKVPALEQRTAPAASPETSPTITTPAASATCGGSKTIFACTTTKGKAVEVCDSGETLQYSFGRKGEAPELAISVPRSKASTFQWDGTGSRMTYSVQIPNGNTVYEVFTAVDRMSDQHEMAAGINVEVAGKHAATLICQVDTVVHDIEGIALKAVP